MSRGPDERYWNNALSFPDWPASRRDFRINRAATDWAARRRSFRPATSSGMQSVFFAGVPDRLSLYEGSACGRSSRGGVDNLGKIDIALSRADSIVTRGDFAIGVDFKEAYGMIAPHVCH